MERRQSQPLKIMVIDDDEQIQYALRQVFDYQGWETISAGDVEEGMKMYHRHHPDLVLVDYHLPRISGNKGVEMLRKEDPDLPLIVLTSDDNQQVADKFLDAGASDFVLKPVKALDIIARIKLHIRLLETLREGKSHGTEPVKGIGQGTLSLIENCMGSSREYLPVEAIAECTGLAYQTTYRYLQYLVSEGRVEVSQSYGKVGRPKQSYRLVSQG